MPGPATAWAELRPSLRGVNVREQARGSAASHAHSASGATAGRGEAGAPPPQGSAAGRAWRQRAARAGRGGAGGRQQRVFPGPAPSPCAPPQPAALGPPPERREAVPACSSAPRLRPPHAGPALLSLLPQLPVAHALAAARACGAAGGYPPRAARSSLSRRRRRHRSALGPRPSSFLSPSCAPALCFVREMV